MPCGKVDGNGAGDSVIVSDAMDPLGNVRVSTVSGAAVEIGSSGSETATVNDGTSTLGKPVTPDGKDTSVVGTTEPPDGNVEPICSDLMNQEGFDEPGRKAPSVEEGMIAVGSPGTPRGNDTSLVGTTDMADGNVPVIPGDGGELGGVWGTDTAADIEGTLTVV